MRFITAKRLQFGVAGVSAALLLAALLAAAPRATAAPAGIPHHVTESETSQARVYWTPRRMMRARPRRVELPVRSGAKVSARQARVARGTPASAPSKPPRRARTPFSNWIRDPEPAPFSTHGKIYGRYRGGKFTCSGTVINTPSNRAIMTAGHCLHEAGIWATHVVFVPAFHGGKRPYGNFHAKTLWVLPGWFANENFNFDVGMITLRPNSRGKIANVVGARGWYTGLGRNQFFEAFGYPAGAARGQQLRVCPSSYRGNDRESYRDPGPPTLRIACNMAGGSSGGGWVIQGEFVNSVVSYGYPARQFPGERNKLYGPYFGQAVKRLITQVGG